MTFCALAAVALKSPWRLFNRFCRSKPSNSIAEQLSNFLGQTLKKACRLQGSLRHCFLNLKAVTHLSRERIINNSIWPAEPWDSHAGKCDGKPYCHFAQQTLLFVQLIFGNFSPLEFCLKGDDLLCLILHSFPLHQTASLNRIEEWRCCLIQKGPVAWNLIHCLHDLAFRMKKFCLKDLFLPQTRMGKTSSKICDSISPRR